MTGQPRPPILIAGPTASGKSALALQIAARCGGQIINADSMQVYRELSVLTARPSPEDLARAPHALYGHVPAAEAYSVARWLGDVARALQAAQAAGLSPVIVGGTGLYFKALLEGLSPVPEIPAVIRARWRATANELGAIALHQELAVRDPVMAGRLAPADVQRVTRALEVIEATGRSLAAWQSVPGKPLLEAGACMRLVIEAPRALLQARADRRFDQMMAAGALDEVRHLMGLGLDLKLPVFGALGVAPLADLLAGRMDREAAVASGKLQTRHFVKRQQTWLKRNMIAWKIVKLNEDGKIDAESMQLIDGIN